MHRNNYELSSLTLLDFAQRFDINKLAEEQCGLFKRTTLEAGQEAMLHGLAPASGVIAYLDKDTGKLVSVRQSDLVNHLLALSFPEEMGIDPARTVFNFIPRLELSDFISIYTKTNQWLKFRNKCVESGANDEELHAVETTLDAFGHYKIQVYIYKTRELALLASNLN